ncbi:MAG: DUF2946 family protein [Burkholderiales bacterium]
MDDAVLRSMAKWPNVPAVYGWLTLDRRGNWLIKGEHIGNPVVIDFIARNYERDGDGRWFFQNGAQRVYVALDYTPFVYRVASALGEALVLEAHNRQRVTSVSGAWIDENGEMLVESEHGVGIVFDRDLEAVLAALTDASGEPLSEESLESATEIIQRGGEAAVWLKYREMNVKVESVRSTDVPRRFGFVATPAPRADEAACT